jgi:hypothetical protein
VVNLLSSKSADRVAEFLGQSEANRAEIFFAPGRELCYCNGVKPPGSVAANMAAESSTNVNPDTWVDEHGDSLYRYALIRERRPEIAEDLVQETLLASRICACRLDKIKNVSCVRSAASVSLCVRARANR